ncbi:site-specific integrase [Candidatus Woesearchaeota archaeon]|nr:site-specific integrase [Candidatus Woesearchaeota archaeon]
MKIENSGSSNLEYLSIDELKNLLSSIKDMRDKLMIKILYETGCTLIELIEIKVADIFSNKIKILDPDTKKTRFARISLKLAQDLAFYIKGNNLSADDYVISTRQSPKISEKRVRQLIQYYTSKFINTKINPQMFRYYHIVHAYLSGVFIENIANQLGITTYRIFQVINEIKIQPKKNHYYNFLNKI